MSSYQSHTIIPGPYRADVIGHFLHLREVEITHEISTRVGEGWHDGPPGPFLAPESTILQSEQTQGGKLSPKLGREVDTRRGIAPKDETLDLVRVPPQKAVEHDR